MRKLRIGSTKTQSSLWHAQYTLTALQQIGQEAEIVLLSSGTHATSDEDTLDFSGKILESALLQGEIDVAPRALSAVSTTQPSGLVVTAVSPRSQEAEWIIAKVDSQDFSETFRLRLGTRVGVDNALRKAQLLDYRPDLATIDLANAEQCFAHLLNDQLDACIIGAMEAESLALDLSAFAIIALHPREFVPAPAQGVIAWQTHAHDLEIRRIFRQLHHASVSACTNVERKVLQLLQSNHRQLPLGVYCFKDNSGFYHVHAAMYDQGRLIKLSQSSSTNFQLAERVYAALSQQSVNVS